MHSPAPIEQDALCEAMQHFGAVAAAQIMRKKRNYALVTFVKEEAAAAAAGVSGSIPASDHTLSGAEVWPLSNVVSLKQGPAHGDGGGMLSVRVERT